MINGTWSRESLKGVNTVSRGGAGNNLVRLMNYILKQKTKQLEELQREEESQGLEDIKKIQGELHELLKQENIKRKQEIIQL